MKTLSEETWNKSTRDENERPLRAKSMKTLFEETWCRHATDEMKYVPLY
jgi:hypothetical protein